MKETIVPDAEENKLNTEPEKETMRISVRSLVEFLLRSGDIDNRIAQGSSAETMQMGSRLHRKIQMKMGGRYQAEVPLRMDFACDDFMIRVEGRADGIIREEDDTVTIDEIKGVLRSLAFIEEPVPVHLAQAKCYAYMYAKTQNLDSIKVRMTYGHLETEEIRYFTEVYSLDELEEWMNSLIEEYRKWARFEYAWHETRQASIRRTVFPFPYRKGQKDLAASVYRSIARKKTLFIQAPTGSGKTLSTVFPAIKAMGEGLGDTLFYLTAKTIARTVAADAIDLLRENGLQLKSIILTAKEKICKCEETDCNPESCPYAKGHYDRINHAVYELITSSDRFTRESIEMAADQYMVCPFELSLDLALWMDAVICDYNYVFHPRARLKRFFADGVKGDYLFLIDEAHNLVDRGRGMFSAQLVKEDFLELKREVREECPKMARSLERCNKRLLEMKRAYAEGGQQDYRCHDNLGTFPILLMNLSGIMEDYLEDPKIREHGGAVRQKVLDFYFQITTFLETCDLLDEGYLIYDEMLRDGRFMLRLFCVDPSANLQKCMDKARGSVLFSATMLPIDYYKASLSTEKDCYAIYAQTCFDDRKLKVLIGADTSSRYQMRGEEQYRRIAEYIRKVSEAKTGNYMVFFPSYKMMEMQEEYLREIIPAGYELRCQKAGMSELQREEFLKSFDETADHSVIGFCVMGSIFGEGIDLRGDSLIGVLIVGTGLPMVCTEQNLLRTYYDREPGRGFRYAYLCPGMNRVLQAAGRVIRTEEDRGVIVLLDDRFTKDDYREMFPREWKQPKVCNINTVSGLLCEFWENVDREL